MKYTVSEKNRISLWIFVLIYVILLLTTHSSEINAQELVELITPNSPIPKDSYKSWSLFLISNPEWVLPESNDKLRDLYEKFRAFGSAIGPEHLSIWFWSRDPRGDKLYKSVDVLRSAAFCTRLKLPPSKGPYVIVTTSYPGEGMLVSYPQSFPFPADLKNSLIIEFNGANASEIMETLNALGDNLVTNGMPKLDKKSEEDFWGIIRRSSETVSKVLVDFSKKVKFKIKTTFFEVEIKP